LLGIFAFKSKKYLVQKLFMLSVQSLIRALLRLFKQLFVLWLITFWSRDQNLNSPKGIVFGNFLHCALQEVVLKNYKNVKFSTCSKEMLRNAHLAN
jgi:hypothetical protein